MPNKLDLSRRFEDPTIAKAAAQEANRVWAEIERRVLLGDAFYYARESVLAQNAKLISRAFGQEVWRRVVTGVQNRDPATMSQEVHQANGKLLQRLWVQRKGRELNWFERLCFRLFGAPLS